MRGRKPKPTALRIIQGNPSRRPLPKHEAKPERHLPECPEELSDDAKREWDRLAPELYRLGLLTRLDRAVFATYCQAWATWIHAQRNIRKEGYTGDLIAGKFVANAHVALASRALGEMKSALIEMGLTPASRSRIKAERPDTDPDEFEELLRGA